MTGEDAGSAPRLRAVGRFRGATLSSPAASTDKAGSSAGWPGDWRAAVATGTGMCTTPPRALRGWAHLLFFEVSLVVGTVLIAAAHGATETFAAAIYAATLSGLFGVSALYHRGRWRPAARRVLQRADQVMILLLIAGSATPAFLLAVRRPRRRDRAVRAVGARPDRRGLPHRSGGPPHRGWSAPPTSGSAGSPGSPCPPYGSASGSCRLCC